MAVIVHRPNLADECGDRRVSDRCRVGTGGRAAPESRKDTSDQEKCQDRVRSHLPSSPARPVAYFARLGFASPPDALRATAARMSALNAPASTSFPSWRSIARLVFPSRLELKSLAGSFNAAPLAKVSFTIDLY